ncbi:MAG: hypothetical protein WD398_14460 [Cyclobacteriaceae bacterium]
MIKFLMAISGPAILNLNPLSWWISILTMSNITSNTKISLMALSGASLEEGIKDLQNQLTELQQASEGEGKSSAGDKYETGREIINQSREVLKKQLVGLEIMKYQLKTIPIKPSIMVEEGAILQLEMGYIWVAVSLGKVELESTAIQVVSKDSPLLAALWGLKKGETGVFRGKNYQVLEIF